jgi:hypothetical protein
MYRAKLSGQEYISNFFLPFGGELSADNRWVKLSKLIPWDFIEKEYLKHFKARDGQAAKNARIAFGALYIKTKCGYSDYETREQIMENPYLQYFLGFEGYTDEPPFDASMMTYFRKRISNDFIQSVMDQVIQVEKENQEKADNADKKDDSSNSDDKQGGGSSNDSLSNNDANPQSEHHFEAQPTHKGKLLLDATCTPADIHFPTDVWLLDTSREVLEQIIDILYPQVRDKYTVKPRTYRENAHSDYMKITKQRRKSKKAVRRAIRRQLGYVERDLGHIKGLIANGADLSVLGKVLHRKLLVIGEIYRQQKHMFDNHIHKVDHRIVSISQPHVRPIKRGKAAAETEFGAKVAISLVDGDAFVDKTGWDNFNEEECLEQAIQSYFRRYGYYPECVIGDRIYNNRGNRAYCKQLGIRISGPRLGRPKADETSADKRQAYEDSCIRNAVEGEFGVGKRKYGLDRIMAKLRETSEAVIGMHFLVMNMERRLRLLFALIFKWLLGSLGRVKFAA